MQKLFLLVVVVTLAACGPLPDYSNVYHIGNDCVSVEEHHRDGNPDNDFENAVYCKVEPR